MRLKMNIFPGWSFSRTVKKVRAEESLVMGTWSCSSPMAQLPRGPRTRPLAEMGVRAFSLALDLDHQGKSSLLQIS